MDDLRFRQAKNDTLQKWREVRQLLSAYHDRVDQECGFCLMASELREEKSPDRHQKRCAFCPDEILVLCRKVLDHFSESYEKDTTVIDMIMEAVKNADP